MNEAKDRWVEIIIAGLNELAAEKGSSFEKSEIVTEKPANSEYGDIAFPMFVYSKVLKSSPRDIASLLLDKIKSAYKNKELPGKITLEGGYLNIHFRREEFIRKVIERVLLEKERYGKNKKLSGQKIMVEFSCPNTNKPLHLGHLRNNALGESVSRILSACGGDVKKVNLINDRGVHICKSMLAYQFFGGERTPESEKVKGDHFVGDYYVKFSKWALEDPSAEKRAQEMLRDWEEGVPEVRKLWSKMNKWAVSGIEETYRRTGITFDKVYYESSTYTLGKEEVLKGLENGVFYKDEEGTVWIDLEDIGLDRKVLLRKDGTTLYLTQDIGTAIERHKDWPFGRLVYVVASEQKYHFAVLFNVLKKLGYPWADNLYHLAYGMVNLPEGKMKSREGTVVDADDLLSDLEKMALQEIMEKERLATDSSAEQAARDIALGAVHYFLLQVNPAKDMVFNPKESLSFNGDTGPYLQYMGARISSMLKKYEVDITDVNSGYNGVFKPDLLVIQEEWKLVKLLSDFSGIVYQAAEKLDPSRITSYLYELAKTYSRYYHDYPILHNEDKDLVVSRITLSRALLQVLRNGFEILGIPFLSSM